MKSKRSLPILFCDTLRPVYVALVAFVIMWKWADLKWPADPAALLGAALTVGSVVVGFLISAQAIIVSGAGRPLDRVKEMGLVLELTDAFSLGIRLAMVFSIVCTVGLFGVSSRTYEALWTASGVAMLYSFHRISSLLFRLVGGS